MLDVTFVVFIWIVSLILAVIIATWIVVAVLNKKKSRHVDGWKTTGITFSIMGGMFLLLVGISWAPYNLKYVTWEHRTGILKESSYSQVDPNGSGEDGLRFVLGDGTVFYSQDLRLAVVKSGEPVDLWCMPRPNVNNADYYHCVAEVGH